MEDHDLDLEDEVEVTGWNTEVTEAVEDSW